MCYSYYVFKMQRVPRTKNIQCRVRGRIAIPHRMACSAPLVFVLAALACAQCDRRPVMMAAGTRDGRLSRSRGPTAMGNRGPSPVEPAVRLPVVLSAVVRPHGRTAFNDNAVSAARRGNVARRPRRFSRDSGNPLQGLPEFRTVGYALTSGVPLLVTYGVLEARPLSSSLPVPITTVATLATSTAPESSRSPDAKKVVTANTSSDGVPEKSSSLPQHLPASKTAATSVTSNTSKTSQLLSTKTAKTRVTSGVTMSTSRPPAAKKVVTSHSSGVSGTSSRLPASKKIVIASASSDGVPETSSSLPQYLPASKTAATSATTSVSKSSSRIPATKNVVTASTSSSVPGTSSRLPASKNIDTTSASSDGVKSSLKPQHLLPKTTFTSDTSKSSPRLSSKPAKTRGTSGVIMTSSQILASQTPATRAKSDGPRSSSKLLPSSTTSASSTTSSSSGVPTSSPQVVSNTPATHHTTGVLKSSSSKPLSSKKVVTNTTMSEVPKSSSQLLDSITSSTRATFGISKSSSSQLPASKTGIVRLEAARRRSHSPDVLKVRRVKKKVTPRCGTVHDRTKVFDDHRSSTCTTQKCDPVDSTQYSSAQDPSNEPFPSDDTEQTNDPDDDDEWEYLLDGEIAIFFTPQLFTVVIIFVLMSFLVVYCSSRPSDQPEEVDSTAVYLKNVECECRTEYKLPHLQCSKHLLGTYHR